jgi:hypothetical protein
MRKPINLDDKFMDIITKMSEGTPGAIVVLMRIMKGETETYGKQDGLMALLTLDDMNIRGGQVWLGYKDHCKEDLEVFAQAIKSRDPEMVKTINARTSGEEVAVTGGASFERS